MMDRNIQDHNMYSKYRLNWSKPFVLRTLIFTYDSRITGDFIIIKDGERSRI